MDLSGTSLLAIYASLQWGWQCSRCSTDEKATPNQCRRAVDGHYNGAPTSIGRMEVLLPEFLRLVDLNSLCAKASSRQGSGFSTYRDWKSEVKKLFLTGVAALFLAPMCGAVVL
jgi:hypothetical protein